MIWAHIIQVLFQKSRSVTDGPKNLWIRIEVVCCEWRQILKIFVFRTVHFRAVDDEVKRWRWMKRQVLPILFLSECLKWIQRCLDCKVPYQYLVVNILLLMLWFPFPLKEKLKPKRKSKSRRILKRKDTTGVFMKNHCYNNYDFRTLGRIFLRMQKWILACFIHMAKSEGTVVEKFWKAS